jgi:putative FmdB family regulatory protein
MPIYEFHCEKCEKDSELLVRSSHWEGIRCPHCGSTRLTKRLSVFASASASATSAGAACDSGSGACGCRCGGAHSH